MSRYSFFPQKTAFAFALALALGTHAQTGSTPPQAQSMPGMRTDGLASQPQRSMQPQAMQSQAMQSQAMQPQRSMQPQAMQPQAMQPQAMQPQARQPQPLQPQPLLPGGDLSSFTYDSLRTQELENFEGHTGTESLPAPELLTGFLTRTPMSQDDFLALAQRSNPTLAQSRAFVEQTEQQARQIALPPNPVVGYSAEHVRGGEYHGGEQGAYVSQQIVLGGKLGLRRDIYRAQSVSNAQEVEAQLARVRDDVGQQFVRTLTAQAIVVLRQRLLKVALDGAETAHQLANLGQADAPDVLTAELEAERAKVDFTEAQREFLGAFGRLAAEAGARDLAVAPLTGDLEQPPLFDAEAQMAAILNESPTVKRARAEVRIAEARLKDARRESVPDLTVKAGEWYSGERLDGINKAAGPMGFVDAGINLPLWNRNQGNTATARVQLARAQNEVERTQLALRRDAEPLAQHYLAARFGAERYRTELLPRARRAYQLYVMKYQQMAQPYLPVLTSQRLLFELQMNYLRALESVWTDAIALQNYTLTQGLEMPMNSSSGTDSTTLNLPSGGSQ